MKKLPFTKIVLFASIALLLLPAIYAADQANAVTATENVAPAKVTAPAENLQTAVGKVVWVKGDFKAVAANKEARKLEKSSLLFEKDKLVTGKNTEAQIVFTDNTLMTFRERTEFVIKQYEYNPKAKSKSVGKYVMNLLEGGFRTVTGLIAKRNPSDYSVETPVATIGVRGTDYSVYFRNGEMVIGFDKGMPCVASNKNKTKNFCLTEENKYAKVSVDDAVPVPLDIRPDALGPTLEIVPASMQPVGSGTRVSEPSEVVNGFCIT